jgi:hypothetical protein
MLKRILGSVFLTLFFLSLVTPLALSAEEFDPEDFIGEFSGWKERVPLNNYYFIQNAISVFGRKWGQDPTNKEEMAEAVWEQLVLSYEAYRRGIEVAAKEIEAEVSNMLAAEGVKFDWKKEPKVYESWVKEKTNESAEAFQNQLSHFLQIDKLRQQVLESFKPKVSEKEAFQEYQDEYNTLELELVQFDEEQDAQKFYQKMKDFRLWEEEAKNNPKFSRKPGFVSFGWLADMWKIPKDDLYKMLRLEVNAVYPPVPIYKGYGVMRILKKREAQKADFPKLRQSYFKQVEMRKKYEELGLWLKKLKEDAGIIVYPHPQRAQKAQD